MPIYPYITIDSDGSRHDGCIEAQTRDDAARTLRTQGHLAVRVDLPTAGCDERIPDVQTER